MMVDINAYEDLMEKYKKNMEEIDAIKKKRIEVNAISEESESQGNVNYVQQGHNQHG